MLLARQGVDVFGAKDRLNDTITKMLLAQQPDDVRIGCGEKLTNWRWMFKDGTDKSIDTCTRVELLEIVAVMGESLAQCQHRLEEIENERTFKTGTSGVQFPASPDDSERVNR